MAQGPKDRRPASGVPDTGSGKPRRGADVAAPEGTPVAYPHTADALAPVPHDSGGLIYVRTEMVHSEPPPINVSGPLAWARENLFSGVANTLMTLFSLYILYLIVPPLVSFAFLESVWTGDDRAVCATEAQGGIRPNDWFGACWAYVGDYFNQFVYGRYPDEAQWRVDIVALLFVGGLVPLLIPSAPFKRANAIFVALVFPIAAFLLLTGGDLDLDGFLPTGWLLDPGLAKFWLDFVVLTAVVAGIAYAIARASDSDPLPGVRGALLVMAGIGVVMALLATDFGLAPVPTDRWGGLLVTMVIAVTGIAASLPIGIALALGRRSHMPIVRLFSVIFIEFWRGVPLITVLFMSSVMLPLFLPEGVTFDKLLRALVGVAMFASAYMAEVVRGGLQAIPKGQFEGAQALGLGYWQMMRMIIMPQALKLVIPGIVNTFIGLFKDTTLVLIIGLFDFLGQIQSSFTDPTWASPVQSMSAYLFAAVVYWVFCFGMSRYSIFMERRLDTGHR
ncbi:amino acid ABC transporter permease [Aquibium sp. A9E412]|uniref:amino acid ABC transporter permease n=1 Tax=Aquibium sp. A9E412 TaxID=2976767 RepID=UPI0025B2695F|nr:amino acid ABC transporter permease [Aquibium sp. A9E412]MDN2564984.1 amino acid ABC transporter permease [Aquibium sp. A9E412]